jgi:hypothetical protein
MDNHITLPCGCMITIGQHATCCWQHWSQLRQLELDNEKRYDEYVALMRQAASSASAAREGR